MLEERIKIAKDVSIVSPWPCIYLENEDVLLVSDIHLGLEDQREKIGMHIPGSIMTQILECIVTPIKSLNCKRIVLLGDVKHEFGRPSEAEWFSIKKFIKALRDIDCEPEVVRGNHDNYIVYVLKELGIKLHDPSLRLGDCYLTHGHQDLEDDYRDAKYIFMGHEHPAVVVKDDVGVKHRFKAFLSGTINNRTVTVLPSISPLSYGNPMNEMSRNQYMTPMLKKHGADDFTPYLIEIGKTIKKFPTMKYLNQTFITQAFEKED
ncbi:MAG: hypothetical protein HMLIMOIP_002041 [Candidatus Nitrosomirales archaeon]|jgi:hypothetical protein